MSPGWLLLALSLLAPAPDEAADQAALLADDLRFAENLAVFRFYDLASVVVGEVEQGLGALPGDKVDLEGEARLVAARVLKRRAQTSIDPEQQLADLSAAIDILKAWTGPGSSFAYLDRMVDAYEDLAECLRERGQLYAERFLQGEAAAQELAEDDFRLAEKAYDDLEEEAQARVSQLEDLERPDEAQAMRLRALNTLYQRGLNSIEWANVATDPAFRLDMAFEQLDEFTWEVPDDQLVYYQALFEQARVYGKLGQYDDAKGLLLSTLDRFGNAWEGLPELAPALRRGVLSVFDSIWGYLASLEADLGDVAAGQEWIDTLLQKHDTAGYPVSRPGLRALLDWARKLSELGRAGEATEILKRVADEGRGEPEGARAASQLASLVATGEVQVKSVSVLMDVAKGNASESRWPEAAYTYLRAGAAATEQKDRELYAYDAWMGAGSALTQLGRYLEAALAYEQAVELVQELQLGTEPLERAAMRMYRSYDARFAETQLPFDKRLRDDASERLLAIPDIELDLAFLKAQESFSEVVAGDSEGFLRVRAEFEAVPPSSPNYERALVYVGRCLMEAGRKEEALAAFDQVEARFADPALEPKNATALNRREIAMAQCRYYHATLLLDEQLARPAEALVLLEDFEKDVAGQESFHDVVKLRRVEAHAMAGQLQEAESALEALKGGTSNPALVSRGAFRVSQLLEGASREAKAAGRDQEARGLLVRAAEAMWLYAETDGFSNFTNMATTGEWYLEADKPDEAQRVFERTIDAFSRRADEVDMDRARIGLAQAFDAQLDFGRSRGLWLDLVSRNPSSTRIRRGAARSYGGWLELDEAGQVVEIAGSGNFADANALWLELHQAVNVNNKWYSLWWESKLGALYTFYRLAEQDPEQARSARRVINQLKVIYPDFDEDTIEQIPEEYRYAPLFKPLYRYLDRKLPPG